MKRKPLHYWSKWNNFEKELKAVIDEIGHFPTARELRELGYSSILNASIYYYGGLAAVGKRFGYESKVRPNNYFKNFDNIKKDLIKIIDELGHFPTQKELSEMGRSYLGWACRHYGGLIEVKKRLGYKHNTKSRYYWKNWKNVERGLKPVIDNFIKKHNRLMTAKELNNLGFGSVFHHWKINEIYNRMGHEPNKTPDGYFNDFKKLEGELKSIIENHLKEKNRLPTQKNFKEMKRQNLLYAIQKHGGLLQVYKRLGYNVKLHKPPKYWKNFDNVKKELKSIVEEFLEREGKLPTTKQLRDIGFHGFHYWKITEIYKRLGYNVKNRHPHNYWKELKNVKNALEIIIKKLGRYPTPKEIERYNSSLKSAISNYHGGFRNVKIKMGYLPTESPEGLIGFIESEGTARLVVEKFGKDNAVVADILAVMYEDRISREELLKLLDNPSLREYMGDFIKPPKGIGEIVEVCEKLLPFDKNQVIEDIIFRKAQEFRRQKLGTRPDKQKMNEFLKELEIELHAL